MPQNCKNYKSSLQWGIEISVIYSNSWKLADIGSLNRTQFLHSVVELS